MPQQTKTREIRRDISTQGRSIMRTDSRPQGTTTQFTTRGDSATVIGDGTEFCWDFSTNADEVTDAITTTIPADHKRKRIKIKFVDKIWIKEGTLYWDSATKGCYVDFWIVCPNGEYYLDRDDNLQQAIADTPTIHYVNKHRLMGSCHMGDELNTEGANEDGMPDTYEIWLEITTPDTDVVNYGHVSVELYRNRTHLLPGESI